MFRTFLLAAGLAVCLASSQTPKADKPWTITTAPHWLLFAVPNAGIEYRLRPEMGVAVRAGVNPMQEDSYQLLTAEIRSYRRRSGPHALWLGVEALWARLDNSEYEYVQVEHHLGLGPVLGYRFEHRSGFTASAHAGPALLADKITGADWGFMPWFLIGADAGWSF